MLNNDRFAIELNPQMTALASLKYGDFELLACEQPPLFSLRTRDKYGNTVLFAPESAQIGASDGIIEYRFPELIVRFKIIADDNVKWRFSIENHSELAVEFLDIASVKFKGALRENGGTCAVVSSYNEGLIVEDYRLKTDMTEPEFPSRGSYMMYPYMLSSPLQMWLYGDKGIVMYVRDRANSPKGLDFSCTEDSTCFRTRIFLGGDYGASVGEGIELVWSHFVGDWHDGAEIYRRYVYETLAAKPLSELNLPEWYAEMPLVITYPVRGIHDMDEMNPNKLFPYPNVLPLVDEFAERTGAKVMVLLMHWEGTAPWAPPYVWPPYGGEESFRELMDKLHADGNLLGVYCSGLSMTERSNLVDYDCTDMIKERKFERGFCKAPDQAIVKSRICPGQRSGYDICPASKVGREILDEALAPLLASGVDYVQALDQNHGGGMYFCYANDHGHPPVPGSWMTKSSLELLDAWNKSAPQTLIGCESAAAEA